jgi:hypothetical protein
MNGKRSFEILNFELRILDLLTAATLLLNCKSLNKVKKYTPKLNSKFAIQNPKFPLIFASCLD